MSISIGCNYCGEKLPNGEGHVCGPTQKYPLTGDELLLLEIDYSSYDGSCKDPHLMTPYGLVECRRERGHDGNVHATRAGVHAITWPIEHTATPEEVRS